MINTIPLLQYITPHTTNRCVSGLLNIFTRLIVRNFLFTRILSLLACRQKEEQQNQIYEGTEMEVIDCIVYMILTSALTFDFMVKKGSCCRITPYLSCIIDYLIQNIVLTRIEYHIRLGACHYFDCYAVVGILAKIVYYIRSSIL